MTRTRASPHTRGWTPLALEPGHPLGGFPAHAGMDPRPSTRCSTRSWLPRTRGDGPDRVGTRDTRSEASPHTRGWTPIPGVIRVTARGFPAHAGMDRSGGVRARRGGRLPRTRGDGPRPCSVRREDPAASPHTRGWTRGDRRRPQQVRGFPAHAGMDLPAADANRYLRGLPRTRGDGPDGTRNTLTLRAASPHTRGWTPRQHPGRGRDDGFPAHAGMDPTRAAPVPRPGRLPRTRGDGPSASVLDWMAKLASPHTRGWTLALQRDYFGRCGFPAHAGMDPTRWSPAAPARWLPRTRGDGPSWRWPASTG